MATGRHALAGGVATAAGTVVLEPRPQGQVYQRREDGTVDVWGEVVVWEPPYRLVLAWHPAAATGTEVEVTFVAEEGGTRVELEHRGWDRLGAQASATRAQYDAGWEDVLAQYAAAGRDNSPAVAALILGLASVVLPVIGILAAPFAIAFGLAGRRRARHGTRNGGLATAGLTLGAIGLVLWGLILALGLSVVVQSSNGTEEPVPVPVIQPGY